MKIANSRTICFHSIRWTSLNTSWWFLSACSLFFTAKLQLTESTVTRKQVPKIHKHHKQVQAQLRQFNSMEKSVLKFHARVHSVRRGKRQHIWWAFPRAHRPKINGKQKWFAFRDSKHSQRRIGIRACILHSVFHKNNTRVICIKCVGSAGVFTLLSLKVAPSYRKNACCLDRDHPKCQIYLHLQNENGTISRDA